MVETGSVLLLTVFASLRLCRYAGSADRSASIGDRIGHRDLLAVMRAAYAVLAAVLMTTGAVRPSRAALCLHDRRRDDGHRSVRRTSACAARWSRPSCRTAQLIGAISISRTTHGYRAHRRRAERRRIVRRARHRARPMSAIVCLYFVADRADAVHRGAGQSRSAAERGCQRGDLQRSAAARPQGGRRLLLDHAAACRPRSGWRSSPT